MPRDGSGNYTLPAGNPVVTGTTISSSTTNSTLTDIATALTGSLSRSGAGGMLVAFQNSDGTVGSPGITWASETASGFYRAGTNDMRAVIGGTAIVKWTAAGLNVLSGGCTITTGGLAVTGGTTTDTLTVNGVSIAAAVPSMSGASGKLLTNNGTSPNWSSNFLDGAVASTSSVNAATTLNLSIASTNIISLVAATATVNPSTTINLNVGGTTYATVTSSGLTLSNATLKPGFGTASGTTVTINQPAGRVTMNAGGGNVTVNNSLVTSSSVVLVTPEFTVSTPASAPLLYVVPGSGSFVAHFTSYSNGDKFSFLVVN